MSPRLRRLVFGVLFVAIALGAVVFAAVAGAATAPAPEPESAVPTAGPITEDPSEAPPPRRYVAMGSVVAMRDDRIALKVASRDQPIIVAVRPVTAVRVNMQKAELAEIQHGDHAVVVGRPGPRGNMIARAIVVARKPTPTLYDVAR